MARTKYQTVDEYIKAFPENVQEILEGMRKTIGKEMPGALETISYGIPTFKLNGKYVIYFAGFKNHVSMYPVPTGDEMFKKEIAPFIKGKGTISFSLDTVVPFSLVGKIAHMSLKVYEKRRSYVKK